MNVLTELACENRNNYNRYLDRMTKSYNYSSKQLIPSYVTGENVLDVGCGSGVLIEKLNSIYPDKNIEGIDLNENAIKVCRDKNLNVRCIDLKDVEDNKYDTIIFSSILHEVSSYDSKLPYTIYPIIDILKTARQKLNDTGHIIIRDGVQAEPKVICLEFKNDNMTDEIKQYFEDAPMFVCQYLRIDNNKIYGNAHFLKEFLFTYTWGKDSYFREVKEKYGILTPYKWEECVIKSGYRIHQLITYPEEYVKYLSKYIIPNKDFIQLFDRSTIMIIATKN